MMVAIGLLCSSEKICFIQAAKITPQNSIGFVIGLMDCTKCLVAGAVQFIVGRLIDFHWDGTVNPDGTRLYTEEDFIAGLSFIPCILIFAFIVSSYLMMRQKRRVAYCPA